MSASILLRKATSQQVRYACLNWHYAKKVPPVHVAFACYEDQEFIGVICYGGGANAKAHKEFGLTQGENMELIRVALTNHAIPTTKYVATSLRLLKVQKPMVKIITSYADITMQNHKGTIYQATNFLCLGIRGQSDYIVNGVLTHKRVVMSKYGNMENARKHASITHSEKLSKILYVYPFDKQLRRELESKAISYQDIEGGAVPTSTLKSHGTIKP